MEWLKAAGTGVGIAFAAGYMLADYMNHDEKEELR